MHRTLARRGYDRAMEVLSGRSHDLVILDEIVTAAFFSLITTSEIVDLIEARYSDTELVLTGRGATQGIIHMCDLVTEMKEVRHYYRSNVPARKGIEY